MALIFPRPDTMHGTARARARFLPALLFLLVTALSVGAQEATSTATARDEAPAQPVPVAIPVTALLPRGAEADALLERVDELVVPDSGIVELAGSLQREREILDGLRSELDRIEGSTVSTRTLTDQRERWQRAETRLQTGSILLQDRWQELVELRSEVQFERQTWRITYDSLRDAGSGPEVLAGMQDLVVRTDAALAALDPRIDAIAELISRVGRRTTSVDEAFAEIDELSAAIRARLFRRDAPPLWRASVVGPVAMLAEVRAAGDYWWRTTADWSQGHSGRLSVLALVFALFLSLTLAGRRLKTGWPDERRLDDAIFVVSRPVSMAALGTLGAAFSILDPITGPVLDILRIIVIVAVIRLGQGLLGPLPRTTFRGIVALYLVATFQGFVPDGALLGRLLTLAMAGGGTVLAYRSFRAWPRDIGWLWRVARGGNLVAGALLLLGGMADVLGWVDLAGILVNGTINSALGAFAWMILLRAIAGLLPLAQTGFVGANLTSIRRSQRQFERAILIPLSLWAVYGWMNGALRNFRLDSQARSATETLLDWSLSVGNLQISVGGILTGIAILIGTTLFARVVRFVLSEEVFPRLQMRPGTVSTLVSLINYIIITLGVVMAATAAGFNATQLTVVLGAMSVGIGFGLQAVVGNFVSGLILMFERPVSVGDQVEAAGFVGKITHIGIRASQLRTFDGSDVIIPNSDLVTRQVVNWTLKDGLKRLNLDFAVGLDSDPRTVMEILANAATEHELVLEEPAPRALMLGCGDSSIDFRLQIWLRVENAIPVPSELHVTLIERLRAAGVEVPAVRRERHEQGAVE